MPFRFLVLLSLYSCGLYCQSVYFPDAQFKKAILNHYPVIDVNFDGEISVKEAASYSGMLNVSLKQIKDLSGIAAFENLTGLKCNHNQIETLDLSKNTALTFLSSKG